MDRSDQRLSLHWRMSPHRQEMTEQEEVLAQWLEDHQISFRYEQLQLIKNNDLAGHDFVDGKKVRKKDVLRGIPDFVFTDGEEVFVIEVTERRRPSGRRPNRHLNDPKRQLRHLTRLAQLDCAVIYRGELETFFNLFEHKNSEAQSSQLKPVSILHQVIKQWLEIEWSH